jgi:putative membrane-bound dehydrogenase-like protein
MTSNTWALLLIAAIFQVGTPPGHAAAPRVTDERYKLELVADAPDIVTPVGMAFDSRGRLLVIESHTHQRPDGYNGPTGDRLRMLSDSDGDGRLDHWSTFAEGFRHAMNVLAREDGGVYLLERGRLLLLKDTDNDGRADTQEELLRLETEDDYPHNALGGIAQERDGSLVIGFGENHGMPYRLIGADGTVIAKAGGQDGVYRVTQDGKKLHRVAGGVWNPFGVCVLPDGRIFAVDNDPDASPPCRLLHIVPGGDYGYLYQYGRAGTHPLQAWNGELPGTLPMVCGTGEAPTAVVAHRGSLWVTSWGDYRIERYRLVPRGGSYSAERQDVVQGDENFRPTGMAVAPDGSLYFGDWVLRDYPVHGQGRIWRLQLPADAEGEKFPPFPAHERRDDSTVEIALRSDDPFEHAAGVWTLSSQVDGLIEHETRHSSEPRVRLGWLEAVRLKEPSDPVAILKEALSDADPNIRMFAVRWIADERILSLRDDVFKLLNSPPPNSQYYLAVLAAVDWLDNEPTMRGRHISDELLIRELNDETRSPETLALALRLVRPNIEFLTHARLRNWMKSDHLPLRIEAVRALQQRDNPKRLEVLAKVASDETQEVTVRAEAVVGLAADAAAHRELLEQLAAGSEPILKQEAARVLRLAKMLPTPQEAKPPGDDLAAWNELISQPGDALSGRRLFFNPIGPRCAVCHKHDGRGGLIGPDLTNLALSKDREHVIASILQPSRDVAPHFQPWELITDGGKTHTGLRQAQGADNGLETYVDSAGVEFTLPSTSIEERSASAKSIMPDGLQETLTIADLRDLVAFLTSKN